MSPLVLGIDPGLQSLGYCLPNGTPGTIKPGTRKGVERLQYLRHVVLDMATGVGDIPPVDLVVIEGFAYGTQRQAMSYEIGGLGWILRVALTEAGVTWIEIPPATLKRYACGRGNAPKEAVLVAAGKRLGYEGHSHDESDASWLRAAGMELLGHPVVQLPRGQVFALDGLRGAVAA
jgi:Holliday junction resolvasome RuvABC endonuclease subunit